MHCCVKQGDRRCLLSDLFYVMDSIYRIRVHDYDGPGLVYEEAMYFLSGAIRMILQNISLDKTGSVF